jgi:hypothetical protein
MGHGRVGGRVELLEWRLRDLEQAHLVGGHSCEEDMRWLVTELRRSRDALLQILARCQDEPDGDQLAADVRYLANGCLGLYPARPVPPSA